MSQSQELAGAPTVPEQFNIEYLLFCHTFNHTEDHISEEDLKMDMITFPYPVYITELRIIPINHRSPEGMGKQMGQTQPSESELTIYIDNVYNLQAAVFETFGVLKYDTKHFMLKANTLTAATKLLVHGIYTSITLCLYGSPAKPPEQGSEPPPLPKLLPPPPVDSKPPLPSHPATDPLPVPTEPSKKQATKSATPTEKGSVPPPLPHTPSSTPDSKPAVSKAKRAKHSRDEKKTPEETHNASGDRLSDYSLVRSDIGEDDSTRDDMVVSGDLIETSGHSYNTMEETLDDSNDQTEQDMLIEDSWSMSFNPSHCQFSPLKFSRNIFSSKAEHSINESSLSSRHRSSSHTASSSKSKGTNRLRELTRRYRSPPNNEKFVFILEDVVTTMSSGYSAGLSHSDVGDHVIQVLVTWTGHSLDLSKIKTMPLAVNVRFLRAGLKLFSLLVRCGETAVNLMLRHNMLNLLMCMLENDLKSSIKIHCIDCISELVEYPQAMDIFIGTQTVEEPADRPKTRNQFTFYQRFMKFLLRGGKKSLEFVTRDLVAKCHFYELLVALQGCVEEIISNYSNLTQEDSASGVWPTATSPRPIKESTTPFPSPVKGANSQNSSANLTDKEVVSFKTELSDKDDLDDVLWGGVEGGVKMEIETMDDSFTKELLEFQLVETDTKSQNKRIAYIEDSLAEKIISYLKKLHKQLESCSDVLDTFPPTHQHTPYKENDPRSNLRYSLSNLVKLLRRRRFLESVLILLMCQNSQFSSKLFSSLRDVLFLLVRSQTGMLYMLEESDCINTMIRLLVPPDAPSHQIYLPIAEFSAENKCEACTPENLGYLIFYHLQVLQLVDELRGLSLDLHKDGLIENNFLESECFRILHLLYTMTLTPLGKHTVVHVLSLEDNILPFLKIVDPPRDERNNTYNIQNILSPSAQYVILLLKVLMHMSQSVDFVFRNLEQMVRLIDAMKECEFGTLGVLHWIEIFKLFDKKDVPQEDKIGRVIKEIELSMDNFNLSHFVEFEPTLLTNIRILSHHLRGVNKKDSTIALDSTITINYIVSSNGVYILTQLIHKITTILLPLWRHGLILKPSETFTLLSLTGNSVYILKLVLTELLSVEGMTYNNSLLLRSLFTLYCLMTPQRAFLSDSACVRHIAVQVSGDIVDICAAYLTNKVVSPPPQEEDQKIDTETSEKDISITKEPQETTSPWSFLLKELFEFSLSAPQFFTGGTLLLSELLPIPLPVYTPEEVTSVVVMEYMKRMRGDWSYQLSAFTSECKTLIRSTAGTSCSELHTYMWKCACQIGDLSATLANAITNQLKELLCSQLEEDSLRKDLDKKLSGRSVYLLGTLAVVTQQASIKAAYLKCIKENFDALKILCDLITREPEICPHSGKLSILMILSSICNPYISLMVSTNDSVLLSDYQVANGLPGHKELACIVSTLLRHVSMRNQSFSCLLLTLRTLANLSHHDQGMVHFYKYMVEEKTFRFFPVFENILEGLKLLDKNLLEDALACVSLLIEFIGVLTISNFFQQDDKQPESSQPVSSAPTVKKIYLPTHFIYSEITQHKDYLQLVLDTLIKESSLEQSGVDEFRNHILRLKSGLEVTNSTVVQNEALPEVRVENLEEQFDKRIVFTVGHQFYFPEYWLPHCPYDQTQVRVDPVFLDLEKIAYETCSGYNLRDELNKLYHSSPSSVMDPNLARHMRMQSYLMSNTSDPQKKFGSITGSSLLSSSIIHKFQRRKQNTSRPPSLHVDDFVAREQASFPKQPSLIPRSPMTPFLISPIPGNLLSSHFPGRVAPGIPISAPVLATNPMIRSAWPTHIPPYPPALTSTLRPQSARLYPHHLEALHDTGPLNRSRFVRGDSIQSRSPSNFSAPRSRQRRDATKSCAKLLT